MVKAIILFERLFRTFDDFVLQRLVQVTEEVTVSGNADNQILVIFRMFLSLNQSLTIHYVELNVCPSIAAGTNQAWPCCSDLLHRQLRSV